MSPAIAASSSRQRALLVALLLIVVSLLAGLGMRQPNPPDEPRFVLAARTMVETGQWLLPHRGSELYAEKPPVFMWLQAATYELIPHWPVAFLLPSLLAALATLWLTWDIARRLWTRRVAGYAVLALFTVLQFGLMAKRAQIDMVLVALTTLSLWGMLRHLLRGPDWRAWMLGLFAAGVGTVTKAVRSGQQLYAENCDLTVLSTVGAGAEVIADGSIHIYGTLRGRALAGAQGNPDARIFCRDFHAELVAIAGHYKVLDDVPMDLRGKAVQVWLEQDQIKIAALD